MTHHDQANAFDHFVEGLIDKPEIKPMSTLEMFADSINKDLIIIRWPNQDNRYCVYFNDGEIKGDGVLIGAHGNGPTPDQALQDYAKQIAGQTLVFHAHHSQKERQEFYVPGYINH